MTSIQTSVCIVGGGPAGLLLGLLLAKIGAPVAKLLPGRLGAMARMGLAARRSVLGPHS